jgi:hypothetical protein
LRNPAALFAACLAMLCAGVAGAQASALSVQDAWVRAILAHPRTAGNEVPLVLLLEGGGRLAVTARVRPLSAR